MNEFTIQLNDELLDKIKEHFSINEVTNETITYVLEEIVSTYYI